MADDARPKMKPRAPKPARPSDEPGGEGRGASGTIKHDDAGKAAKQPPRTQPQKDTGADAESQPAVTARKIGKGKLKGKGTPPTKAG